MIKGYSVVEDQSCIIFQKDTPMLPCDRLSNMGKSKKGRDDKLGRIHDHIMVLCIPSRSRMHGKLLCSSRAADQFFSDHVRVLFQEYAQLCFFVHGWWYSLLYR